ncbi:MAG TPA: RluA family pseudouridine synthase, partial [Blastocatellia bacterium]|nr:RluA family pseudouridine synthase [Blastocatellia bacterium]
RLDRATSGLMVVARTQRALTVLSRHFHRRMVEKRYAAIVRGVLARDEETIIASIGRDPERRPRWWVMEGGRDAETRLRVLKRGERTTLLELEPVTGRTNQLRIHCAYLGHPVVGDELYDQGAGGREQGSGIDNRCVRDYESTGESNTGPQSPIPAPRPLPPVRLCLHAWRLAFHHPACGRWMEFDSAIPAEMAEAFV